MKKIPLLLAMLLTMMNLQAQTTGEAAVATTKTATSTNSQNWTFAAIALVTAAGAIFVISMDNGSPAS